MKKQPLKFRMNSIGASLLIFLAIRTYMPLLMVKVGMGKNINIMLVGYIWCEILACMLPIAFLEYMCDFHPYLFGKKINYRRSLPLVLYSMLIFLLASVVNRIVIVRPLTKIGVKFPQPSLPRINSPLTFILCLIFYTLTPAVFEELYLRGLVLNLLKDYGQKFAIIGASLVFMIMHTQIQNFLPIFIAGMTLACIYVYTDNIYISMMLHFANNFYSFMVMYSNQSINGISAVSFSVYMLMFIIAGGITARGYLKRNNVSVYSVIRTKEKAGVMRMFNSPVFIMSTVCCLIAVFDELYKTMIG